MAAAGGGKGFHRGQNGHHSLFSLMKDFRLHYRQALCFFLLIGSDVCIEALAAKDLATAELQTANKRIY